MSRRVALLLLLVLGLVSPSFAAPPSNPAAPVITFGSTSITIAGLTPRRQAVVFGAARVPIPNGYWSKVVRWQNVVDTTADGTAVLDLGVAVPMLSQWAVVDATDGRFAVAAPPSYHLRLREMAPDSLRRDGGDATVFAFDRASLDLLYVHPGLGAWVWHGLDGASSDRDGLNGRATVSVDDAQPLMNGAGDHPARFAPGGVLVAIDARRLQISVTTTDVLLAGGAQ